MAHFHKYGVARPSGKAFNHCFSLLLLSIKIRILVDFKLSPDKTEAIPIFDYISTEGLKMANTRNPFDRKGQKSYFVIVYKS